MKYQIFIPSNGTYNTNGSFTNVTSHIKWKHVGNIEADSLEEVFYKGNHDNTDVRSLSVGDIIIDDEGIAHMIKGTGFEVVQFNLCQANN